jgi:uncharacterized protein
MFKTGSPVKGQAFIDRKKHLPIFKLYLQNNQHVAIKAPRRFGKTSLVKHVFEYEKSFEHIYIDIRRATTLRSLANQIIDKAYNFVGIDNFLIRFKSSITSLLKNIQSVKIDTIGEITLRHLESEVNEVEFFLHALDVVDEIAKNKEINIKFVFDEFQDIYKVSDKMILEQMRSVMQHHEHITYIFLGSIESMMTEIFEDKRSSFFHFSRIMKLSGLDVDELYDYADDFFTSLNISHDKSLKQLLIFLQGHPDYSMQILQAFYYRIIIDKVDNIDMKLCIETLSQVLAENKAYLEELISQAKTKKHHFEVLSALANNTTVELTSRTLYNTHISLENHGLVKNTGRGLYELTDIFLKIFLQIEDVDDLQLLERVTGLDFGEHHIPSCC